MLDTSRIHALIARTRRRLRFQAALETATTAVVLAATAALAAIYATRMEWMSETTGLLLAIGSVVIVVAGAVVGATHRIPEHMVAQRLDRASNLADRLGTACAFETALATANGGAIPAAAAAALPAASGDLADPETRAFMEAAIRDAVAAAPRASIAAAAPYRRPRDLGAAAAFVAVAAVISGLYLRPIEREPHLARVEPGLAPIGAVVTLLGARLMGPAGADSSSPSAAPASADDIIWFGEGASAQQAKVSTWSPRKLLVEVPDGLPLGPTTIRAWVAGRMSNALAFEVVDARDKRHHSDDAVSFDDDDLDYTRDLLEELKRSAEREADPTLAAFTKGVEELLAQADRGELTKEQLLEKLSELDNKYQEGADPTPEQTDQALAETGKELKKNPLTKELGEALEKGDLQQAKEKMEELADKLEKNEVSDKQREELAKSLDKAAEAFAKKEEAQDKASDKQQAATKEAIRRLEDKQKQAKNDQQREDLQRQIEKKKRELKKLEKDKEDHEQSAQKRRLKRLHNDMKKAAENLKEKQDKQEQNKQASKKLRDIADDTGEVEQDKRKTANQKKVASQMEDLKEAMRRAKRKGGKGPPDLFGKNQKNRDFDQRARGQKGNGKGWKPGQGQGQGQGEGDGKGGDKPGGDGKGQGGDSYGTGHDDDIVGDSTDKSGDTTDEGVQGVQGKNGTSTRETILSAAQKGFASKGYKKVYGDYKAVIEEVMRSEKVPSGYKYFVKKYFQKIKPHSMD